MWSNSWSSMEQQIGQSNVVAAVDKLYQTYDRTTIKNQKSWNYSAYFESAGWTALKSDSDGCGDALSTKHNKLC